MNSCSNAFIEQLHALPEALPSTEVFTIKTNELLVDLSRHYLNKTQLHALTTDLEQQGFHTQCQRLFTDNGLNFTEQRAVSHVFLRDANQAFPCRQASLFAQSTKQQTDFAQQFAAKAIKGIHEAGITDLLTIGIGGSHLGADLVTDALHDFCQPGLKNHYLTGSDPYALDDLLATLPAATTLVFVASKSFTTMETLENFTKVQAWFLQQVGAELYPACFQRQFFAMTANKSQALAMGFEPKHVFSLTDSIGGRFSLWSAVGLPMRLCLGETHYHALLEGAHAMDQHFNRQALSENLPVLLAILDLYYANRCDVQQRAVIPYTQRLRLLVNHLQQLEMESNGKSVHESGEVIDYHSGLAVWGGVGPNSQHSFHQWLYQGTRTVPIDFIALAGGSAHPDFDQLLLSQCLAQAKALWEGQALAPPRILAPQVIRGGIPSTLLLLKTLNPRSLGELIALYEHKVFVIGLLTGTNAFDQFGVEAGKTQGVTMLAAIKGDITAMDPITQNILNEMSC